MHRSINREEDGFHGFDGFSRITVSLSNSGSAATEVSVVAVLPSGVTGANPISGVRDATGNMNVWSGSLQPTPTRAPDNPAPAAAKTGTPGFTGLLVLIGLATAAVLVRRR